jgi:hypothetical protein
VVAQAFVLLERKMPNSDEMTQLGQHLDAFNPSSYLAVKHQEKGSALANLLTPGKVVSRKGDAASDRQRNGS